MLPNDVHLDVTEPTRKIWKLKPGGTWRDRRWTTEPKISDICEIEETHAEYSHKFSPVHPIGQDQRCLKLLKRFLPEEEATQLLQDIAAVQGTITIYTHEAS